jgi:hypothetical protein
MKALERTVLFAQQKIGTQTHTYPLSVHANERSAKAHKALVSAAHSKKDVQAVMALAPAVKLTEDGKLHDNIRFALKTLPYEPAAEVATSTEDEFAL